MMALQAKPERALTLLLPKDAPPQLLERLQSEVFPPGATVRATPDDAVHDKAWLDLLGKSQYFVTYNGPGLVEHATNVEAIDKLMKDYPSVGALAMLRATAKP